MFKKCFKIKINWCKLGLHKYRITSVLGEPGVVMVCNKCGKIIF